MLIDLMSECVRTESITTWSKDLISEMRTFVYDGKGKADHMGGRHSDAIISLALCLYADQILRPPAALEEAEEKKAPDSRLDKWRGKRRERGQKGKRSVHPRLGSFA